MNNINHAEGKGKPDKIKKLVDMSSIKVSNLELMQNFRDFLRIFSELFYTGQISELVKNLGYVDTNLMIEYLRKKNEKALSNPNFFDEQIIIKLGEYEDYCYHQYDEFQYLNRNGNYTKTSYIPGSKENDPNIFRIETFERKKWDRRNILNLKKGVIDFCSNGVVLAHDFEEVICSSETTHNHTKSCELSKECFKYLDNWEDCKDIFPIKNENGKIHLNIERIFSDDKDLTDDEKLEDLKRYILYVFELADLKTDIIDDDFKSQQRELSKK